MVVLQHHIEAVVRISGIPGFTGHFQALGGGEVNDTFLLDTEQEKYILRITRRAGRDTLRKEAEALKLLDLPEVPKLIFFDPNQQIEGHYWIVESYVEGIIKDRLNENEFNQLGRLLAKIHKTKDTANKPIDLWQHFLYSCRSFGDERALLDHEDTRLRGLINRAKAIFNNRQSTFDSVQLCLVHGDATPSNILVNQDSVRLIDWEFARFSDPMMEFSTIYYDDMEFNRGKWRIKIKPLEKQALFAGYAEAGGQIDEERIVFWMNFDKLGAAVYLYWKIYQSGDEVTQKKLDQYSIDLNNLSTSLERNL